MEKIEKIRILAQVVEIVLTAHPTQINRRTLQYKHIRIAYLLEYNAHADLSHEDRYMLIEDLICKMDLEARSLQQNVKVMPLAKLREYKSDLNNLKIEVKRMTSANFNQAARNDFLEAGLAAQRGNLVAPAAKLKQSSERIKESRPTMLDTEVRAVSVLQDLRRQRQSLLNTQEVDMKMEIPSQRFLTFQ